MRYTNAGLTIWFGTQDAPASTQGETLSGATVITIGVAPPNPSNRVEVRYRVDGGRLQTLSAICTRTDYAASAQYFQAIFPPLPSGALVEYLPVLTCGGRQVPDLETSRTLLASFRCQATSTQSKVPPSAANSATALPEQERFPFSLEYLFTLTAQLNSNLEMIGETPEGLKVNWFVDSGVVRGPMLQGIVRFEGGDWMTIRPDGIGDPGIRATIQTEDNALIYMTGQGVFDLGEDGYHNFLANKLPPRPIARITPRFITAHRKYQWINRLHCLAVGVVITDTFVISYDVYAVK